MRARERARGAPRRADRLLLPDARLGLRGRGRRAGDVHARLEGPRPVRGPRGPSARGSTGSRRTSASTCSAGRERRARPMDLGPAREPSRSNLHTLPEVTWIEPIPDAAVVHEEATRPRSRSRARPSGSRSSPRSSTCRRASAPCSSSARSCAGRPRGRRAPRDERRVGEQRAPARPGDARGERLKAGDRPPPSTTDAAEPLARYVEAFERYDMDALTALIHEDATQSMPPFDLWLAGRDDILTWWVGPGAGCRGSRVVPTTAANGSPAFGQYKPEPRATATSPGRCRCSSSRTAGSSSSPSSSTPTACSRSSASRPASTERA